MKITSLFPPIVGEGPDSDVDIEAKEVLQKPIPGPDKSPSSNDSTEMSRDQVKQGLVRLAEFIKIQPPPKKRTAKEVRELARLRSGIENYRFTDSAKAQLAILGAKLDKCG